MHLTEQDVRNVIRKRVILEEIRSFSMPNLNEQNAPGTIPDPAAETLDPATLNEIDNFVNIANSFSKDDPNSMAAFAQSIGQTGTFFAGLGATTVAGVAGTLWGGFYGGLASAALAGAISGLSYAAITQWIGGSDDALNQIDNVLSPSTNSNPIRREVDGLMSQINNKRVVMPGCTSTTTSGGGSPTTFSMFVDPSNVLNPSDFLSFPIGSVNHSSLPNAELSRIATIILDEIHKAADASFSSGNVDVMKNIVNNLSGNGVTLYDLWQIDAKVGELIDSGAYTKLQFRSTSWMPGSNITTDFNKTLSDFKGHYASKSTSNIVYLLSGMVDAKGSPMYDKAALGEGLSALPLNQMKDYGIFALPGDIGSAMQCYVNNSGGTRAHYQVSSPGGQQRTNIGQAFFQSIALTVNQKLRNAWNSLVRVFNRLVTFARSTGSTVLIAGLAGVTSIMSGLSSMFSGAVSAFTGSDIGKWLMSVFGKIGDIITGILDVVVAIFAAIKRFFSGLGKKPAKPTPAKPVAPVTPGGGGGGGKTSGPRIQNQNLTKQTAPVSQSTGGYIKVNLTGNPSIKALTDVGYVQGSTSALYDDLYSRAPRNYVGSEDLNFKVKTELGSAGNRKVTVRLARGERRRALRGLEGVQNAIKNFLRNVEISDADKFGKIPSQRRGNSDIKEFELVVKIGTKR